MPELRVVCHQHPTEHRIFYASGIAVNVVVPDDIFECQSAVLFLVQRKTLTASKLVELNVLVAEVRTRLR